MKPKGRFLPLLLFCAYIAAVAAICFMKPDNLPTIEKSLFGIPIDKVVHFLMFLPYPVLAMAMIYRTEHSWKRHLVTLLLVLISGTALAYSTELIQAQTGYRSYEIKDLAADSTGLAAGCLMTIVLIFIERSRRR